MRVHNGQVLSHGPDWVDEPTRGVEETYIRGSRIALLHDFGDSSDVYRSGHNSWSPAGWRGIGEEPLRIANPVRRATADDPRWDDPSRHHSSWLLAVADEGRCLLVGALEGDTPRLHADLDLVAGWTESGQAGLWVTLEGPEIAVFERYRQLLASRFGARDADPGTVWSSWYSFYESVSRESLDELAPQLPGLGFDTLQIDDGWERIVGDWVPNEKFQAGMADAASSIKAHGLRPGLWLAPFIVLPGSEAFTRDRDLLLHDERGELVVAGANWGSSYYGYDFTRPEAHQRLAETISTVVGWGYSYLKLDFLQAAASPALHHAPMDREAVYRSAIETIREAAGEDVYILGSGAPLFSSLGVLDAVRTGPDVAPFWTNYATDDPSDALAFNALRNGVERLWMRHLIGIDPDVFYVRRRRNLLTEAQIQWLKDCAALSGFRANSDPPDWLSAEEREELRDFLAPLPATERLGRYTFRIGERTVDFGPALGGERSLYAL